MAGVELIILAVIYGVVTAIWNSCVIVVRQSEGAPPVSLLSSSPLPLPCTRGHARRLLVRTGRRARKHPHALLDPQLKHPPTQTFSERRQLTCACPPRILRAAVVLERFSKFHRILESGINFIVPCMDAGRQFSWTRVEVDESGNYQNRTIDKIHIDLRESVFNFQEQQVFTKDTVLVDVDAVMYYRIFDVKKAVYEIDDLQAALCNTAQTQLKEVFGNLTFTEALQSQTDINAHLHDAFGKIFSRWGVECIRMELRNLKPNASQQIAQSMKKQMVAERHRRGEFIRAEGEKTAMRLEAEGNKAQRMNLGIANQEATRKRSEGEKDAKIELAYAESRSLTMIGESLKNEPGNPSQVDYMMSQRYLETIGQMSMSQSEGKTIYLPYDLGSMMGTISTLTSSYGLNRKGGSGGGGGGGGGKASRRGTSALD
jgi:regulator of protease activity HflC (stomatin/prohibitin superfamily)